MSKNIENRRQSPTRQQHQGGGHGGAPTPATLSFRETGVWVPLSPERSSAKQNQAARGGGLLTTNVAARAGGEPLQRRLSYITVADSSHNDD